MNLLLLLILLLLLSAFFSGAESAFFSLRRSELAEMSASGGRAGRRVAAMAGRAHRLLPGLLIGNVIVNTLAGVVGTALAIAWLGPRGIAVAVPALTAALLLLGEITPKLLALRYRRRVALLAEPALALWLTAIKPLVDGSARLTGRLIAALPYERTGTRPFTAAELDIACGLAVEEGALTESEGGFLARLLGMQRLEAWQVMTPRPEVVALDVSSTRDQILEVARATGFNRYPVTAPDRSQPVGFFHLKDLLARPRQRQPLAAGLRPVYFVPEGKEVAALLTELRTTARHLAVVVNEHGDFTGIVTLDDCLRALTGRIGDESDRDDPELLQVAADTWIVEGGLSVNEVEEGCGVALPHSPHYATLGGLVMARLGRIPARGDRVETDAALLTVVEMSGRRVARVRLDRRAGAGREGAR